MPNHVKNVLAVTGAEADLPFLQQRFAGVPWGGTDSQVVSFEGFVSMPYGISQTAGLDALADYVARDGNGIFNGRETTPFEGIPAEQIRRMIEGYAAGKEKGYSQITVPFDTVEDVRKAYDLLVSNRRVHGQSTWYRWCPQNWGTKWDAYDVLPTEEASGRRTFRFTTAWAPPLPVIAEASRCFPELTFDLEWSDEGGPWGREIFRGGSSVAHRWGRTDRLPEPDCEYDSQEYRDWEDDPGTRVEVESTGDWPEKE